MPSASATPTKPHERSQSASPAAAKDTKIDPGKRRSMMEELGFAAKPSPKGAKGDEEELEEDDQGEDDDEYLDEDEEGDEEYLDDEEEGDEEELEDDEPRMPKAAAAPAVQLGKSPSTSPRAGSVIDKLPSPLGKGPVPYADYVEVRRLLDIEHEEREAVQKKLKETETLLEQSKDSVKKQTAVIKAALEAKLVEKEEQIEDLEYEIEELKANPKASEAATSAADSAELVKLRADKMRIEEECSRATQFAAQMKAQLQSLSTEVASSLAKPLNVSEKAAKKLKKEKETVGLVEAYENGMQQWSAMKQSLTTVSGGVRALIEAKQYDDRLLTELKTLRATLKEMQTRVEAANVAASKQAEDRLERDVDSLKDQLAQSKKDAAAAKEVEVKRCRDEIKKLSGDTAASS
eukprot:m51a1_g888 hypothetical protein (406) ;mRNA; f:5162-7601